MSLQTENLIKNLTGQLKPVVVTRFTAVDFLKVLAVGCLCLFSALALLGLRFDLLMQLSSLRFFFENLLLVFLAVISILAAFRLSIPSQESKSMLRLPFFAFFFIGLTTVSSFLTTSEPFLYLGHGFSCVTKMLAIGVLPASVLFYIIRQGASLHRDLTGMMVLVCGVSFGLLGVQWTCPETTPLHLALWHVLPAMVLMVSGIWFARKILTKI
ncbi:MAG: NrsF family protein [Bdellovibrio sp.]|jgi:hypothetical protein